MGCGESGFSCWGGGSDGPRSFLFLLFLFYVNVSGMRPRSRFYSQLLTIPAPWVILRVRWSIPPVLWFHPGLLPPVFWREIGKLS